MEATIGGVLSIFGESIDGVIVSARQPDGICRRQRGRVVYRGEDSRIFERVDWNGQWLLNDMSATRGALKENADPMGFVDANGAARIVYRGDEYMQPQASDDNMLYELFYSGG